jgi:hypothetical protein
MFGMGLYEKHLEGRSQVSIWRVFCDSWSELVPVLVSYCCSLSWARRYDWNLPKRKGGAISAIKLHSKPGDALIAAHEELEEATKTALMQTLAKAAQQVAGKPGLDVSNTAQLRDICLAAARIFGWDGKPQTEVNITNQVGVVCDEATRMRLIKLRESLQVARPALLTTLPEPGAQLQANVGAANGDPMDVPPDGRPGSPWSMSAGAQAPSDASPVLRGPQETVSHIACVNIVSGDRTNRIVGKRDGALEGAGARARNVERGESTIERAHEPVINIARVHVLSRDRPCRVDTLG